jgi:hypothetical protein
MNNINEYERGYDDCVKELSTMPAVAWTGKGCGEISDKCKQEMIANGKYGGEFACAAITAERHDIPLIQRPVYRK